MPLMVEKLENGTVIDRIDAGQGILVLEKLRLLPGPDRAGEGVRPRMALLINVPSRHMGHKDILKIEGRELAGSEVNKIALLSPHARLNVIQAGRVVKKQDVKLPEQLIGVAACPNPQCVSGAQNLPGHFYVQHAHLRCKYCERLFRPDELVL